MAADILPKQGVGASAAMITQFSNNFLEAALEGRSQGISNIFFCESSESAPEGLILYFMIY